VKRALVLALAVLGCEPAVPGDVDGTCADPSRGTEAYFESTMKPDFFEPYCSMCHWSDRGNDRHGTPEDLNYDIYAEAISRNGVTWHRVSTYDMPPMGRVPDLDEMALLNEFLNCSLPAGDDDDSSD
jgi:hypothetical protein